MAINNSKNPVLLRHLINLIADNRGPGYVLPIVLHAHNILVLITSVAPLRPLNGVPVQYKNDSQLWSAYDAGWIEAGGNVKCWLCPVIKFHM